MFNDHFQYRDILEENMVYFENMAKITTVKLFYIIIFALRFLANHFLHF